MDDMKRTVEALLFATSSPLTVDRIRQVLPEAEPKAIRQAIDELKQEYEQGRRSFGVAELAGGYQLLTLSEFTGAVARLQAERADAKPSPAALDALAIVAYKQPITRAEIEAIRGVQSGEILRGLMDKGLIRITGRAEAPGAPLLYGTTRQFLDAVGIARIEDLPKPQELK